MSLINDALKKAQKQRTGEAPPLASMPSIGGESPGRIAKRAKPAGFNALLLRLGLGAGALLLVVVIGAYFAFRSPRAETAGPTPPSVAPATATPPPTAAAASTKPAAAPTFNLPISPVAQPPDEPRHVAQGEGGPARPAATATPPVTPKPAVAPVLKPSPPAALPAATPAAASASLPAPAAPVPAVAKMDNKAVAYIENLRIAGIRASATDSKVLMNDRVYRIGDIVEHELGLKLIAITSSSMTFEDERGARYTRNF